MTYEELVKKAKDSFEGADASNVHEHVMIQFIITGEGRRHLLISRLQMVK